MNLHRPDKNKILFISLVMLLLAAAGLRGADAPAATEPAKAPKTIHLLTVGNSFSHNAMHYLPALAKADGNLLVLAEANIGGASMEVHWVKVEQHEKDPNDPHGTYYAHKGLKEILASDKWDFVTIQQASIKSHDPATYQPFAGELRDYVAKYAPQAELLVHETWPYRVDDARFAVTHPASGQPATQEQMYQQLSAAYRAIAAELKLRIIPVGDAFNLANTDAKWGYHPDPKFDPKTAVYPELPDQAHSLNAGWSWAKLKNGFQLHMDGHHASMAGEYLGGCVFYEVLFGRSAVGNTYVPKDLDPDYARFLQETAHKAVLHSVQ